MASVADVSPYLDFEDFWAEVALTAWMQGEAMRLLYTGWEALAALMLADDHACARGLGGLTPRWPPC